MVLSMSKTTTKNPCALSQCIKALQRVPSPSAPTPIVAAGRCTWDSDTSAGAPSRRKDNTAPGPPGGPSTCSIAMLKLLDPRQGPRPRAAVLFTFVLSRGLGQQTGKAFFFFQGREQRRGTRPSTTPLLSLSTHPTQRRANQDFRYRSARANAGGFSQSGRFPRFTKHFLGNRWKTVPLKGTCSGERVRFVVLCCVL
jgi:hypothetical protein